MRVKAFGMIAEKLPLQEFDFPVQEDTDALLESLNKEYPVLTDLTFTLAVNRQMINQKTELKGNEEIALLPPFSGG